jgi:hypothetical protein
VTFVGAGNISRCGANGDEQTAMLLDRLVGTDGYVFAAGDNVFPNNGQTAADAYRDCYGPNWGRHLARTHAALGNHEYQDGVDATFDYFGDRAGPRGQGFHSFDIGEWHVIVLNDNGPEAGGPAFDAGSQQDQWLIADLAQNRRRCTLAIWHSPLFLSSVAEGYIRNGNRKTLWDRLYAAGAEIVINAQQHQYERFPPMTPDGTLDDARGIRQFNVGTGGESTTTPTEIHPLSAVIGVDFGVLRLLLKSDGYDWEFHPVAGKTFTDSGSGTCH